MTEPGRSAGSDGGRRRKRFFSRLLSPSQKHEIWLALRAIRISPADSPRTVILRQPLALRLEREPAI